MGMRRERRRDNCAAGRSSGVVAEVCGDGDERVVKAEEVEQEEEEEGEGRRSKENDRTARWDVNTTAEIVGIGCVGEERKVSSGVRSGVVISGGM